MMEPSFLFSVKISLLKGNPDYDVTQEIFLRRQTVWHGWEAHSIVSSAPRDRVSDVLATFFHGLKRQRQHGVR
jgi:hypothetical protein